MNRIRARIIIRSVSLISGNSNNNSFFNDKITLSLYIGLIVTTQWHSQYVANEASAPVHPRDMHFSKSCIQR